MDEVAVSDWEFIMDLHFLVFGQRSYSVAKGQVTGSEPHVERFLLMRQTFSHSRSQTANR